MRTLSDLTTGEGTSQEDQTESTSLCLSAKKWTYIAMINCLASQRVKQFKVDSVSSFNSQGLSNYGVWEM